MAKQINPGQMIIYATSLLTIFSVVFAGVFGRLDTLLLGLGIGLVSYSLEQPLSMTLLLASLAIFLSSYLPFGKSSSYLIQGFTEGFESGETEGFEEGEEGFEEGEEGFEEGEEGFDEGEEGFDEGEEGFDEDEGFESSKGKKSEGFESGDGDEEGFGDSSDEESEGFVTAEFSSKNTMEGFANEDKKKKKKRRAPPDHGSRPAEMFELGKKYTMPKETDDPEFHLDAGTTFLNAYKSLNPDQVSAMTKDTQDLINTQKQLMSTLNTLKPLITDGKQMMDTFQNYFGAAAGGEVGDLAKMAEKFAPK
jgi:hypothetical protein